MQANAQTDPSTANNPEPLLGGSGELTIYVTYQDDSVYNMVYGVYKSLYLASLTLNPKS